LGKLKDIIVTNVSNVEKMNDNANTGEENNIVAREIAMEVQCVNIK
jgi:hypothetical protein